MYGLIVTLKSPTIIEFAKLLFAIRLNRSLKKLGLSSLGPYMHSRLKVFESNLHSILTRLPVSELIILDTESGRLFLMRIQKGKTARPEYCRAESEA